ncbi:uncharacterized protein OCT59_005103 [Rhizophagus irregularis]|uniref:Uncharacterized protein n=1 Tax=Rhizophagus irregularis (strain DAOM 181602 / DAOM 197198 / MUCL 43194) TaxID=747089 RepID=U9SNU0_RHIID|nr:hypothetical protein OCT59_005103 [Rhizophagus irregularis]GBC21357.2 hypothetical protein GLOIN_2v1675424 [Rhizophagus irregularis DAOM 181602=DAOM 197198]CAG8652855.1 9399_t:CDS:1 [Rhizophagus irregularis]
MDYYNILQNNDEFNNYSNNLQPLQMDHTLNNNVDSSCDYSDFSSITSNNNIPTSYMANNYEQQQSLFSSINNENYTTTTQSLSYEPQYTSHTSSHDSHIASPLNSLNMITNSSQINRSDIFKFEIPGFKIVVIPTSSTTSSSYANLNNFDTQNQVQQGYTSPIVDSHNSQTQFNNFHN